MMIPENYLQLQQRIHTEARSFGLHKERGPPILSWNDILKYESVHVATYITYVCISVCMQA